MKRFLQAFGFKESRYERPNQKWVCGWRAEGKECPLGPDARGHCHSIFECTPLRKDDRWHCTRPASAGGRCEEGPLPDGTCCRPIPRCRPARSVRARRGLVSWLTLAFALGGLMFLLGGRGRWRFVSPGPLTKHHAMSEVACADCHVGANANAAPKTNRLIQAKTQKLRTSFEFLSLGHAGSHFDQDSRLCLNCHELGTNQFQPHGLAPEERIALTRQAQTHGASVRPVEVALASLLFGAPARSGLELACATCHREHHGTDFSLTHLENAQCQSCHAHQFTSLANGHPAFTRYPYSRRTRILFDHVSHLEKHFQEPQFKTNAPTACLSCHEPDTAGRRMLVQNFSAACASCHAAQIEGEGRAASPGIAFLQIPGLDTQTLAKRGLRIGDWPAEAEGKLTPFMQTLLSTDAKTDEAIRQLAKLDLLELQDATADELQAVGQFAWAVKDLFFELATEGQAALRDRLQKVVTQDLSNPQMTLLVGQLPMDALTLGQRDWFPNLLTEVPLHQSGGKPVATKTASPTAKAPIEKSPRVAPAKTVAPDAWVARGGWYRQDYAILYRPTGHADAFVRGWLDFSTAARMTSEKSPLDAIFNTLSSLKSPGLCMKCHSLDARGDATLQVNWWPARPMPDQHAFTRFSHAMHFSLLGQKGCLTCHQLDSKADYAKAFENNSQPGVFSSNFRPMQKSVCSGCHTAQAAGNSCLGCHNYHVGTFAAQTPAGRLRP